MRRKLPLALGVIALETGSVARASDWTTTGGNNARTGASLEVGPTGPNVLWTTPNLASLGTPAFVEGSRAFRVSNVTTSSAPSDAQCFDLDSGAVLWTTAIPYGSGTGGAGRCLGVDNGQVYVTRGRKIYALSSTTGAIAWESALEFVPATIVGPHAIAAMDLAFAPNGDPIVDGYESIFRLRASDGTTAWETLRPNAGVGGYGVAVANGAVYALQISVIGNQIANLDLVTGALRYASSSFVNALFGNPPSVGNDGSIHIEYIDTGASVTFSTLLSLRDTGAGFVPQWSRSTAWVAGLGYGTCPDGSVVHVVSGGLALERLDVATGAVTATSAPFASQDQTSTKRITVDALGRVFFTNGGSPPTGKLLAFDENLVLLWEIPIPGVYGSGPALGRDGTLVIAGSGFITALRSPHTRINAFCTGGPVVTACPCGSGLEGNGCPNSVHEGGARLAADGVASVSNDTFTLRALDLPDGPCLFLQGTNKSIFGSIFGDGLVCVTGMITRLGVESASLSRARHPAPSGTPISVTGQIPGASPTTRMYQVWYRDAANFCTAQTFNLSNGLEAVWVP